MWKVIVSRAYREESYRQGRSCNLLLGEWTEKASGAREESTSRTHELLPEADSGYLCTQPLRRYGTTTGTALFAKVRFKGLITLSLSVEAVQAGSAMWSQRACLARRPKGICAPSEVEFIARDRMNMIARYLERRAKRQHHEPLM
jgi:hypothetical protein